MEHLHNILPMSSLPQCRPHPKGDYYFIVTANDTVYHWMLYDLTLRQPFMYWK
jgi:hypothetical protein